MAQPRLVRDSASRSRMLISKATQPAQPADEHGSEHDAGDETEDPGPRVTLRGRDQNHHASGGALLNLGKRESGTERLEQAVAAFIEALKERTRERVPPSTGPRRRAILAEPKRGKADRRDADAFSATPGRETTAKFRRVDPGERIIHDKRDLSIIFPTG